MKRLKIHLFGGKSFIFLFLAVLTSALNSYGQGCNCPAVNSCGSCVGGLTFLTLKYNGVLGLVVTVTDGGGVIYTGSVASGGTFSFYSSLGAGNPFQGGSVTVAATLLDNTTINTTCNTLVHVGYTFGNFTVVTGQSRNGGTICCAAADMETTPPVISNCPSNISVSLDPGSCSKNVSWTAPTATDNCSLASLTSTHAPGSSFPLGTTTVTYTAKDNYGNTATCSFNVTVNDVTNPTITSCPTNITANASGACNAVVSWTPPTASDNCSVTLTSNYNPGSTFPMGTTIVTYTATDGTGNTSTCSFNVTVNDQGNPVFTNCPTDISATATNSCDAVVNWTPPTASDNCIVTLTSTHNPGTTFPLGTTVVTYTATDGAGNASTCSFNVTVTNATIYNCPTDVTVNTTNACNAIATWTTPSVSNNCNVTLTSDHDSGDTFPLGTTIVTYTATDGAGNTSTCSFNVTVNDVTNPTITNCPSDITVNATSSCNAIVNWTVPTASDNCSVTLVSTHSPGAVFPFGQTTVTYTATDGAGNTSTCAFNVIVNDGSAPVINNCPIDIIVDATSACNAVASWTPPTASDNCTVTLSSTHNPGETFPLGATIVTYTATDGSGNVSTCSFKVTVKDVTSPLINNCPTHITTTATNSCNAVATWTAPTASDNCSVTVTSTHNPGETFPLGTTIVTYTATDGAGNIATCSFNVTVNDEINPTINNCPDDITATATGLCNAIVTWAVPTASDNCSVTLTSTHSPGASFPLGTTIVTYTATDGAGNTSTCSFNVIVNDATSPTINNCPTDITVNATSTCDATVSWTAPTAADNCNVVLTSTHNPGSTFSLGTTVVTYTATDGAGNTSTCSFKVIVKDLTNPVIDNCPSDITVNASTSCDAVVNWTGPSASDNCSVTLTSTHNAGETFSLGTTTVIYTATDGSGNIATCSFNVTVNDVTKPAINNCPPDVTTNATSSCTAVVTWVAPTASDNCSVTLASNHNPGEAFPLGVTTVTYTATDGVGNTATCSFNVTVNDVTNPTITNCPSDIIANATTSCNTIVNWTAPSASDNCSVGLTSTHDPGASFPVGITTVTYTATDGAGNISTCSFSVTINDVTSPVISNCPSDKVVNATASCNAVVNWIVPTASDNCNAILTGDHSPGETFPLGTTIVTYTAKDQAGNASTCSFNVIVKDVTSPVIVNCPSNIAVNATSTCEALVNWTAPTASDNCTVTLASSHDPGDPFSPGTTIVTYTAVDGAGNTATCAFSVTVNDVTNPTITNCPADITASATSSCDVAVSWIAPSASDNCSVTLTSSHQSGETFPTGTTVVTYTATDGAGNTSTCSFNVVVNDIANPIISNCPTDIAVNATTSCDAVVYWTAPAVSDNCSATLTSTHNPGETFPIGTTTVTYTATDAAGNISTCSFTVTVEDLTSPTINNCPSDIVVNITNSCEAIVNWTPPTASDNCNVTLTSNFSPGDTFFVGSTDISYIATDEHGNTATCTFKIIVADQIAPPVITNCPDNITIEVTANCGAIVNWEEPQASDNCSVTLTSNFHPGDRFTLGVTEVIYTATDGSGNTVTCSFQVTVVDTTTPIITHCPENIVIDANPACESTASWITPDVVDHCAFTLTSNFEPGGTFPLGVTTVTYVATDESENQTTCSFDITVRDITAPSISNCPDNIVLSADHSCGAIAEWSLPTGSDNCGFQLESNHQPGDVFLLGTTTVVYTATDDAGNVTTCAFDVTIQDTTSPIISNCPENITVYAGQSCSAAATWEEPIGTDNCGGVVVESNFSPGDLFELGTTHVIYTMSDPSGNVSTCAFEVTVVDNSSPSFVSCPSDIQMSLNDGQCEAIISWDVPVAQDNCNFSINSTHPPGSSFSVGTTQVTYTALDDAGNTATCTFNVIVKDAAAPVFVSCPQDLVVPSGNTCTAMASWNAPEITDCSEFTLEASHHSGTEFPIGTTTVTYTATDEKGNTSTCSFKIIVKDLTAPVFKDCPGNIELSADESCTAVANWSTPIASDNCGDVKYTYTHEPGHRFDIGITKVVYSAEDVYGNVSTCEFTVNVIQNAYPVFSECPADIVIKGDEGGKALVEWTDPIATSACSSVTVQSSHGSGEIFLLGTTVVTFTAVNDEKLTATCTFKIIVEEQEINFDINSVVTPDGDGFNDVWLLPNIEKFSDNEVILVDRWGSVVFSTKGYNNENNVWNGENLSGALVPSGTYFYTVEVKYASKSVEKRGFIEVVR